MALFFKAHRDSLIGLDLIKEKYILNSQILSSQSLLSFHIFLPYNEVHSNGLIKSRGILKQNYV